MSDSEEDSDNDQSPGMNLTGFLFGNVDENGVLENDVLDPEAKQHLGSLYHFGLGSLLQKIISEEKGKEDNGDQSNADKILENGECLSKDDEFAEKSPSALDFSDINELAEDCSEQTYGKQKKTVQ